MAKVSQLLKFKPHPPGDPGPDMFKLLLQLDPGKQAQALRVIGEANASISKIQTGAVDKLNKIAGG